MGDPKNANTPPQDQPPQDQPPQDQPPQDQPPQDQPPQDQPPQDQPAPGSLLDDPPAGDDPPAWESLDAPEGWEPGEADEEFTRIAREAGLSKEKAQELYAVFPKVAESVHAQRDQTVMQGIAALQAQALADPELAGGNKAKLREAAQAVGKLIDKWADGDKTILALKKNPTVANDPAVLKLLRRLALADREDKSHGGTSHRATLTAREKAMRDWPNSPEMWPEK